MASNRRLETHDDFNEAMEKQIPILVFQEDHIVSSGGTISRFDDRMIVIQSGVSDIAYFRRDTCEFFAMNKR